MRYITLGQDDKELSEIVLGMMRIKDKSVKEVEELVETALSVGINAFDLADIYGRGRCEELLGLVLKNRPDLREKIVDSVKNVAFALKNLPILIFQKSIYYNQLMGF